MTAPYGGLTKPKLGGVSPMSPMPILTKGAPTVPKPTAPTAPPGTTAISTTALGSGTPKIPAPTTPTLSPVPADRIPKQGTGLPGGLPQIPPPAPTETATFHPTGPITETLTPLPATPVAGTEPPNPSGAVDGPLEPFTTTPTDPNNPLTGQTIGAGPGLDRFQLAQQQYQTFVDSTSPSYQAALRDAKRVGAAAGGLGSGQLRTSIGDLVNQRSLALDTEGRRTFQDALMGSVDDARFATGLAERQQGFQAGQQQQGFQNEFLLQQFEDAMRRGDFNQALALWQAGNTGGTGSGTALAGAAHTNAGAQSAMDALTEWLTTMNAQRAQGSPPPGGP